MVPMMECTLRLQCFTIASKPWHRALNPDTNTSKPAKKMGDDENHLITCIGIHLGALRCDFHTEASCISIMDITGNGPDMSPLPLHPSDVFHHVKRLMGRRLSPQHYADHGRFLVKADENGRPFVHIEVKNKRGGHSTWIYHAEELLAMFLRTILDAYPNLDLAVITVPACLDSAQRHAVKDALRIAGVREVRLLNETSVGFCTSRLLVNSTSLSLAVHLDAALSVSVLRHGVMRIGVVANGGDTKVGLEVFVAKLMADVLERQGVLLPLKFDTHSKLLADCVGVVCCVSRASKIRVTHDDLYQLCQVEFHRCMLCIERVIREAGLEKDQFDQIILIGTSLPTEVLAVLMKQAFPHADITRRYSVVQDDIFEARLQDVTSGSISLEAEDGSLIEVIKRHTPLPAEETCMVDTRGHPNLGVWENATLIGTLWVDHAFETSIKVTFKVDKNGILDVRGATLVFDSCLTEKEVRSLLPDVPHTKLMRLLKDQALRENCNSFRIDRIRRSLKDLGLKCNDDGDDESRATVKQISDDFEKISTQLSSIYNVIQHFVRAYEDGRVTGDVKPSNGYRS
eukprot:Blabericola_migrator_1__2925@NODE_1840_length_3696_cov_149_826674_g200_i1_p1_GENE_NODE_1840_length_3696_cov_149_826674_g200_i1NODE_1840_length_3696_cov_149_826674_g200_i1_p1_ORF_typecomplete_len571_score95_36HSP70/PF00012_20/1_7e26HSP70/PF00012_20/3e03MreB_Mbl/PF06723_13/3e05_NODE_1840_length_3696_cov_149_826674_g200_i17402452